MTWDGDEYQARFDSLAARGADVHGEVARAYGVKRKYVTPVKRATFVIGTDAFIHEVIASEWSMDVHADQALAALASLTAR